MVMPSRPLYLLAALAALALVWGCSMGPEPAQAYKSGIEHFNAGEFEEALADFDYAIDKDPGYLDAYTARGLTLFAMSRYEEALEANRTAVELGKRDSEGYYLYGLALDKLGRREEAVEQYKNSLGIEPRYWLALNGMGYSHFYLEEYPEAVKYFSEGMEYSGRSRPKVQSSRGYAYLAAGMTNLAMADFDEALKSNPGSRNFRLLYALGLGMRDEPGDADRAREVLAGLLSEDDEDLTASHAYALLGRKEESLGLLKRHTEEDPYLKYEAKGRLEYREYRDDPEFLAIVGG